MLFSFWGNGKKKFPGNICQTWEIEDLYLESLLPDLVRSRFDFSQHHRNSASLDLGLSNVLLETDCFLASSVGVISELGILEGTLPFQNQIGTPIDQLPKNFGQRNLPSLTFEVSSLFDKTPQNHRHHYDFRWSWSASLRKTWANCL